MPPAGGAARAAARPDCRRPRAADRIGRRQIERFGEAGGGLQLAQRRQKRARRVRIWPRSSNDPVVAAQPRQTFPAALAAGRGEVSIPGQQRVDGAQALGRVAIQVAERRVAVGRVGQVATRANLVGRPALRAVRGMQRRGVVVQLRAVAASSA